MKTRYKFKDCECKNSRGTEIHIPDGIHEVTITEPNLDLGLVDIEFADNQSEFVTLKEFKRIQSQGKVTIHRPGS